MTAVGLQIPGWMSDAMAEAMEALRLAHRPMEGCA